MIINLGLVSELNDEAADWELGLVCVEIVDALIAHVAGEDAAVSGEAGDSDSNMIVNLEDLLLVRGKFGVGLVYACQHHMALRSQPYRSRALLHRLHSILHLEETPRRRPCCHIGVVLVPEHFAYDVVAQGM